MTTTKEQLKKSYILDCRYYDGKRENPYQKELRKHLIDNSHLKPPACMISEYDIPHEEVELLQAKSSAFDYERNWVMANLYNHWDDHVDDIYLHYLGLEYEKDDGTPASLKSMFFNRYVHWNLDDTVTDEGLQSFKDWYRDIYASKPTWRKQRQAERGPKLLQQCSYYKGESLNPWEFCYTDLLRKRKLYWYISSTRKRHCP